MVVVASIVLESVVESGISEHESKLATMRRFLSAAIILTHAAAQTVRVNNSAIVFNYFGSTILQARR